MSSIRANRVDPTRTKSLRRRYAQRLRGQFGHLNATIREGVRNGAFHTNAPKEPDEMPVFDFPRRADKVDAFMAWLTRQFQNTVLEVITRGSNPYIRTAYERGLEHAQNALQDTSIDLAPGVAVEQLFRMGVHQDKLELLFTRNFRALTGITDDTGKEISRVLTDGLAQGWNPTKMADRLTDRVNSIGKRRATVMARTETINAHAESTLTRFEQVGVDEVTIQAEFLTADDDRVCPICHALEGTVMTISDARNKVHEIEGREVTAKPPVHPQCRCTLLPVVS